jgi:multidrug efflux pump
VVFGLGIATVLTLVFTPSLLALRVWWGIIWRAVWRRVSATLGGTASAAAGDMALSRAARKTNVPDVLWTELRDFETPSNRPAPEVTEAPRKADPGGDLQAAE